MAGCPPVRAPCSFAYPFHDSPLCWHAAAPQLRRRLGRSGAGYLMQAARPPCRWTASRLRTGCRPHRQRPPCRRRTTGVANPLVWLHFNLAHAQALRWIQRHAQLPDAFFEALKEGSHSTRIERDDDAPVGVLNDAHFDFALERLTFATLWICVLPRRGHPRAPTRCGRWTPCARPCGATRRAPAWRCWSS